MGQKENKKRSAEGSGAEEQKRPGSAVSREFQPNRQQKAGSVWRKQQQDEPPKQAAQQIYGFVPFKSATAVQQGAAPTASSIYGTAIRPSNPPPHQVFPASDYLHSIYAPPQMVQRQHRAEPSMGAAGGGIRGTAQIQHQGPVVVVDNNNMIGGGGGAGNQQHGPIGSRPGSDLGMYKMMSSRCQSYTTLPRPEHAAELFEELGAVPFAKIQPQIIYGTTRDGVAQIPFRPPSAASRSLGRKNSTTQLPPAYFGGPANGGMFGIHPSHVVEADFIGGERADGPKEVVAWSTVSLSSWLTIVFGAAIFSLGAVRLYWRADYAKGQELFYGISAICSGLVGFFASQNRSFCMFVAAFLLTSINTVFIFVPFLSGILPLAPMLSSNGKPYISLGGTKEPVEVDIGLAVLSLMQLAAAFSLLLYGCRAFGTTMRHVNQMRMAAFMVYQQQKGGGGGADCGGSGGGVGKI